jgi:hypothetical protein
MSDQLRELAAVGQQLLRMLKNLAPERAVHAAAVSMCWI